MKRIFLILLHFAIGLHGFIAVGVTGNVAEFRDTLYIQEITVTGIKQSTDEAVLSPASTSIKRHVINREGINSIKTAASLVPNLFVPDYGSRMTSAIYVRGIGARMDQPAVGLTIDNMPVMCKENYDLDIMDIDRIEVLRGPQSAMFGRNTMGGVINIYTLSPFTYQGTRAMIEGASRGSWRAGVSHYQRWNKFAMSGSLAMNGTNGEFTNLFNGRKCDWERQGSARVKTEWMITPHTLLNNKFSASISRQGGYPYERVETGVIAYNDTCFYRRTSINDAIEFHTPLLGHKFSAFASYQYLDDNMTLDQDFTPLPYFTLTQARKEHAATLDAIMSDDHKGNYSWKGGVSSFYRHINMNAPVTFLDTGIAELIEKHRNDAIPDYPVAWDERQFILGSQFKAPTWGVALYHSSEYKWKKLSVRADVRLDYEHAALNYRSTTHTGYNIMHGGSIFAHETIDIDDTGKLHKHYLQLLPSFTATYNWNDHNRVRATISRGSKAGGYNTQMFSDVLQQRLMGMMGIGSTYDVNQVVGYKPESAWNYELGTHIEKNKVTLNLNMFYTQCRDLQLTIFPDGNTTGRMMTNAGKSRNMGVEASIAWQPRKETGVTISYGFTHAQFVEYNDGKADYKDKYIPYAPAHTLYANAHNRWAVRGCGNWLTGITLSGSVKCAGRIYWNEANTLSQPFYALMGTELTLEGHHHTLELWARNLTGTQYKTFYFVSMSREFLQLGHGRTLGATLRLKF